MTKVVKLSELEALYDAIDKSATDYSQYECGLPSVDAADGQAILGMLAQFCITHGLRVEDDTKPDPKGEVVVVMSSAEYGDEEFRYASEEEAWAGMQRLMAKSRELKDGVKRMYYIKGEDE